MDWSCAGRVNGVEIRFEEVSGHSWCLSTSAVMCSALWSFEAVECVEIESGSARIGSAEVRTEVRCRREGEE